MRQQIKTFWDWFAQHAQTYYDLKVNDPRQEALFGELIKALHQIDSNLGFEFSMPDENGLREFVITANGIKDSFPLVFQLEESAPPLQNWQIVALKPRLSQEISLNINGKEFSYDDMFFRYRQESPQQLGLQLHLRCDLPQQALTQISFLLLDILLGEYDVATKIGSLEFHSLDESLVDELNNIRDLPPLVDQLFSKN